MSLGELAVILRALVKGQLSTNRRKAADRRRPQVPGKGPPSHKTTQSPWESARTLFAIDPRSLAVFRMAMGALLLADLGIRATDLRAMYTDEGMFPRSEIFFHYTSIWNWSLHLASGSWVYQAALFSGAAVFAVALLAGFKTRFTAIASWLMLISLHHRVPPILSGADILMRVLLFWAMFLPLGRVWSADAWLQKRGSKAKAQPDLRPVLSVASAAILLQMALMYLFSAIFKSNHVWFSGEALAGILAYDFYASPLGAHLLHFPALLRVLTWSTFVLEWAGPLLLFSPRWTPRLRLGVIAALAAMHVGIALCMEVDFFSPVALAGLSLFLPAEFWYSRLAWRFSRAAQPVQSPAYVPSPQTRASPALIYVAQGAGLLLLVYVILINVDGLANQRFEGRPALDSRLLQVGLGLAQKWSMFDDIPSKNGWYVAAAKLKDGSDVDLLRHGAPVDWNKPPFPPGLYPNHRWRKCFREMSYADELGYQVFRAPVARFLCRHWNARAEPARQIASFDLIYCNEVEPGAMGVSGSQVVIRERFAHLEAGELQAGANRGAPASAFGDARR